MKDIITVIESVNFVYLCELASLYSAVINYFPFLPFWPRAQFNGCVIYKGPFPLTFDKKKNLSRKTSLPDIIRFFTITPVFT